MDFSCRSESFGQRAPANAWWHFLWPVEFVGELMELTDLRIWKAALGFNGNKNSIILPNPDLRGRRTNCSKGAKTQKSRVTVHEFRVQPSRRPKKRPVTSKVKLLELGSKICRCWVSHCAFEPAKCRRLGWVQRNPTKSGVGSTQPSTKCNVPLDWTNSNFGNEVSYERRRWPKKRPV